MIASPPAEVDASKPASRTPVPCSFVPPVLEATTSQGCVTKGAGPEDRAGGQRWMCELAIALVIDPVKVDRGAAFIDESDFGRR